MKRNVLSLAVLLAVLLCASWCLAQDAKTVKLPEPKMAGGRPLMEVLKERKTIRSFSTEKLSDQVLSNLLWAAWGVNRPESGKRTAPSASNMQEIDIYVAKEDGLYLFDAKEHALKLVLEQDLREKTGTQGFVKNVPVNLVYVADFAKMRGPEKIKEFYSAADTGFISQNVYLFCASEGLGTVVRGLVNRTALAEAMKLRPDQRVILSQSVGYPKK
jgi:SagB-type dehydrogenase family enzyme